MEVTVRVEKAEQQPLGIAFRNLPTPPHCQVAQLVRDGAAASSGQVKEGDLLLSVNGQDVQLLSPDEVRKLLALQSSDHAITLGLRRPATNGNQSNGPSGLAPDVVVQGSSPDSSPTSGRRMKTRRTGAVTQEGKLPQISEYATPSTFPNLDLPPEKRLSFTPEMTRKMPMPLAVSKSLDLSNLPQWRQASKMVPLQNLLDGTELHDRLHNQEMKYKNTGCHPTHCLGSHMWPRDHRSKRTSGEPRPKDEMLPLAEDFVKQYYDSRKHALGNNYEHQLQTRLGEVRSQIEEKGHYELTYEELVFGARTAWRNAPRCVNRIVWRQLEILDAREANTPKDMFDAICHHIKYGNNGGNLRSTITVFRHRTKPKSDFRVWNSQLIGYAGYKNSDGTVLGDPARVEFTEVCVRLGWRPPEQRGEYDILPLVLQAQGGEAQMFEIPRDLVIEVELQHPQYPWFQELGLRWYALPAVAAMMLDVGGLEFTGIPFNGWYMGTEIARDLGDASRYNKLKPIAQGMGLNIQTDRLWKDQAAIVLNSAVLYSFQKANVSVVDHHSATESFMTHMKAETQSRGGCPADWVWIVPPISGSITPVFHQEMLLYYLTPSYEYQEDPWKRYHFPGEQSRTRGRTSSIKFKTVATIVRRATGIFQNVYQKRVKATIVYATETGRSKNYATVVKDVFGRVFATKVTCMEDYNKANLDHEQLLIVVTSTFGSGDPPANGETFGRYLLDLRNGVVAPGVAPTPPSRKQRMSTVVAPSLELLEGGKDLDRPLTQVKYAVFGLGSRAYPNFCTYAHTCDNLLRDLGAEQIFPCGEGDELCGQEESFQSWLRDCYLQACETYKLDPRMEEGEIYGFKPAYSKEGYRVIRYSGPVPEKDICRDLSKVHSKDVFPAVLKSRSKLQAPSSERSTILLVLDTKGTRQHYVPGDHVAIYPQNSSKLVGELLERLSLPCDPDEPFFLESRRESKTAGVNWVEERRMPVPVTLREAFTNYLDITNPPTPSFLQLLAQQASKTTDKECIEEMAKGGNKYEDWKYERFPNLIDVVNQFHSLKIPVTLLLQELPLLQCRFYSISSSPLVFPDEVHITVAVVSFRKRGGQGPKHNGVCSTWLNRMEPGTIVPCFMRRAPSFHLPEDPRTPVIMVGPGTGLAPFRSFWQDRMYKKNESLKSQLSLPSQKLKLEKPSLPRPQKRQRRSTTWVKPNPSLLLQADEDVPKSLAPLPIRRSASDEGVSEEIAKILAEKRKAWGSMSLYFGCRCSSLDHIYKEEMKKAQVSGALTEVHVALSREPGQPKTYVQHLLKKNADAIIHQLMEERGHFYVCGDISMAADVSRTLQSIFEANAAMTSDEARRMIDNMKDNGFYHEDIFGVTLKTAEVTSRVRTAAKKAYRILVSGDSLMSPGTPLPLPRSLGNPIASRPLSPRPTSPHPLGQTSLAVSSRSRQTMPTTKRPTVTVLNQATSNQTAIEPTEPKQFRQSLPVFDQSSAMKKPKPLVAQKEGVQLLSSQEPEPGPVSVVPQKMATADLLTDPLNRAHTRKITVAQLCAPPPDPVEMRESSKPKKKVRAIRTRSLVQTEI